MRLDLNPEGADEHYLEALNSCFGGWGGQREFDWYFRRPFGGRVADRFVISEGGEWLAGSAVSWRRLMGADGVQRLVGIMTGSWTLPAARGRGCFRAMIDASRQRCVEEGAAWLLAFVTKDNGSRRLLQAAGSLMIPTHYLWSEEGAATFEMQAALSCRQVDPEPDRLESWWRQSAQLRGRHTHLFYEDAAAWTDQFIDRPLPTDLLEVERLGSVAIERHPVFDRVLASVPGRPELRLQLERAVHARALHNGRRFFTFTTSREHAAMLRETLDLGGLDGFITLLGAAEEAPNDQGIWAVESGDRV